MCLILQGLNCKALTPNLFYAMNMYHIDLICFASKNNSKLFSILFEIVWEEQICKICQTFPSNHKTNRSDKEAFPYYWIMYLHSIETYCDIVILTKLFFLGGCAHMFTSKAIKVCLIIAIYIQSCLVSSYWFVLIKIFYIRIIHKSMNYE